MDLNSEYLKQCSYSSQRSAVWKRTHHQLWVAVAVLTLSNLLMAVVLLGWREVPPVYHRIADWLIPAFNGLVAILTIVQLTCGPKGRWLTHRATVQGLWKECVYYRAALSPYDGEDADQVFKELLERTARQVAESLGISALERFRRTFAASWSRLQLPDHVRSEFRHLPEEGLQPRLSAIEHGSQIYLTSRLKGQLKWYVGKARQNRRRYILFQIGIVSLTTANLVCLLIWGRQFWMLGTTVTVLTLVAWRDFLDCYSLWFQYGFAAARLRDIEQAYHDCQPPFNDTDNVTRFRKLVTHVEAVLFREYESWQALRLGRRPLPATDCSATRTTERPGKDD